jgi:hypothetical protein
VCGTASVSETNCDSGRAGAPSCGCEHNPSRDGRVLFSWAFVEDSASVFRCLGAPVLTVNKSSEVLVQVSASSRVWVADRLRRALLLTEDSCFELRVRCPGTLVLMWLSFHGSPPFGIESARHPREGESSPPSPPPPPPGPMISRACLRVPDHVFHTCSVGTLEPDFGHDNHGHLQLTDSLMWRFGSPDLEFCVDSIAHTKITRALTSCVREGVLGEYRNGMCVLAIGPVPLGSRSWHFRECGSGSKPWTVWSPISTSPMRTETDAEKAKAKAPLTRTAPLTNTSPELWLKPLSDRLKGDLGGCFRVAREDDVRAAFQHLRVEAMPQDELDALLASVVGIYLHDAELASLRKYWQPMGICSVVGPAVLWLLSQGATLAQLKPSFLGRPYPWIAFTYASEVWGPNATYVCHLLDPDVDGPSGKSFHPKQLEFVRKDRLVENCPLALGWVRRLQLMADEAPVSIVDDVDD